MHTEKQFRYYVAGEGYCKDWVYLPEGGYPAPLAHNDPKYSDDRIQECMNRCLYAAYRGLAGSEGSDGTRIGNQAFYIKASNQGCGCSSGTCEANGGSGYTSYNIYDTVSGILNRLCTIYTYTNNFITPDTVNQQYIDL